MPFQIIPIPAEFVARVRSGFDDQAQPTEFHNAQGGEPLRDLLRRALPGERIALASFCPFQEDGPYKEFGPVFVSAAPSGEEPGLSALPAGYLASPFVLRAYSSAERIVDAMVVEPEAAAAAIDGLLARQDVAFILARFLAYGCYACRIERS